jgi:hypothetical protein
VACTSPQPYSSLSDGSHTFQVRAKDNVDNVDATPASFTWTATTFGPLFGILYDDAENPLSFTFNTGVCQFRSSLSSNFPRTAPRVEQFILASHSGWAKFFALANNALLGAQLNFNANAGTAANAFNQGHNLHKLTLTSAAQLTIPIFPPNC